MWLDCIYYDGVEGEEARVWSLLPISPFLLSASITGWLKATNMIGCIKCWIHENQLNHGSFSSSLLTLSFHSLSLFHPRNVSASLHIFCHPAFPFLVMFTSSSSSSRSSEMLIALCLYTHAAMCIQRYVISYLLVCIYVNRISVFLCEKPVTWHPS